MGLLDDYEDQRYSLLNRNPTPTLAVALAEMKSEEVRKKTVVILALPSSNQNVLATPTVLATSSRPPFRKKWCDFHKWGFHSNDECKRNPKNKISIPGYTLPRSLSQQTVVVTDTAVSAAPAASTPTMKLIVDELAVVFNYRLSQKGNSSGISASSFPNSSACSVASACSIDLFPDTTTSLSTPTPADAIDPLAPGPDFPSTSASDTALPSPSPAPQIRTTSDDSLYINCGGKPTNTNGSDYVKDDQKRSYYVSEQNNWAYSCSGTFESDTANSSDYVKNNTDDISNDDDRVLKNFNPKAAAGAANKEVTRSFNASVKQDDTLRIHLYWAGKGSLLTPPATNGPLISAISVTSEKRIELPNGPVSVRQIIDATNNFSAKMELGRGGSTSWSDCSSEKAFYSKLQEFNTEVYTLSSLKHENLVQLYGGYSGKELHLLIYEYMEHKSIVEALFETRSRLKLDWKTRREIYLGIAKGLKYLHEESTLKIVHRDIKAQNILLGGTDGNPKTKISDFGLEMLFEGGNEIMVSRVAGTNGYLAPEYAMRGILSQKADVYSFGVLLLEIVSGKSNAVSRPTQETVFLLDTAYVYNKEGRLADLVDKDLSGCYNFTEAMRILNLAMMCTSQTPTLRPTMSEVVSVLQDEKTIEQVFGVPPTDSSSTTMAGAYLTSSAEISSTSNEVSSSAFTSYFMIKENQEKKSLTVDPQLDISSQSNIRDL
ncbi:hypothetical protein RJ640_000097, partial [Escallonia rubra]